MRKLAAGNWKMNGTRASLSEVEAINAALDDTDPAWLSSARLHPC